MLGVARLPAGAALLPDGDRARRRAAASPSGPRAFAWSRFARRTRSPSTRRSRTPGRTTGTTARGRSSSSASGCSRARATTRALWTVAWAGDEIAGGTICEAEYYEMGWVRSLSVRRPWRRGGLGMALLLNAFRQFHERGRAAGRAGRRRREPDRGDAAVRAGRHARRRGDCDLPQGPGMSRLRAKCPECKTYTAVALGPEYECHVCGRTFSAGLVRVPRAWGEGGEPMAEAAPCRSRTRRRPSSRRTRCTSRTWRSPPSCRRGRSCSAAAAARTSAP